MCLKLGEFSLRGHAHHKATQTVSSTTLRKRPFLLAVFLQFCQPLGRPCRCVRTVPGLQSPWGGPEAAEAVGSLSVEPECGGTCFTVASVEDGDRNGADLTPGRALVFPGPRRASLAGVHPALGSPRVPRLLRLRVQGQVPVRWRHPSQTRRGDDSLTRSPRAHGERGETPRG